MKISIIIAYYNRRDLFMKTLESISSSKYSDFEIVVVDDASDDDHRIIDLPEIFTTLNLRIVQIDKEDKWWINPCIPNNIGFAIASGDVFIIQNPECLHVGDIISYVAENILINKYIVFGCYAIDSVKTQLISKINGGSTEEIIKIISPTNNIPLDQCPSMNRWYQHSKYSDRCLNFCTAIIREDLEDLGGFDEEFAHGIACDDTEFVYRIKRKGMYMDMVDNPFVVHQCHGYTNYSNTALVALNHNLRIKTLESTTFRVFNKHVKPLVDKLIKT